MAHTLSLDRSYALAGSATIAEQERIVNEVERRLSVVDAKEQAIATNLARAERLRQSILQQAFSGRLVRPQRSKKTYLEVLGKINNERKDLSH